MLPGVQLFSDIVGKFGIIHKRGAQKVYFLSAPCLNPFT